MAKDAAEPSGGAAQRGKALFLTEACSGCHQIRGTDAHARVGPDLTHVASRSTIAALTLPNQADALHAWIDDPQHQKPGVRMPALELSGPQIQGLIAYLDSLR
jgi:cytochrome c oxidase subunit 2